MGHLICASLSILEYLKPTKSMLFCTVVMGTLLICVEDVPGRIRKDVFNYGFSLLFGAFVTTVACTFAALSTGNVLSIVGWQRATGTVVAELFLPRRGAVAGNAVSGLFFASYMIIVSYYLQWTVGSWDLAALAHVIYFCLLLLEEVKPQRHILLLAVLLVTIVLKPGDQSSKIIYNFALLLMDGCIVVPTALLAVFWVWMASAQNAWGWVTGYLEFVRPAIENRVDRIVTSSARVTTVFGHLDAVDGYMASSSFADPALSVDGSDAFYSVDSDYPQPKKWLCCVGWCGSGCQA